MGFILLFHPEVIMDERDSSRSTVIAPPPLELFPPEQMHEMVSRPPPLPKEAFVSQATGSVREALITAFVALLVGMVIGSVGVLICLYIL